MRFLVCLTIGLLSTGCGGRQCGPGTVLDGNVCIPAGEADADADADSDADADAPEVLLFAANAADLTEGGSVTFTAVVRDGQGVDDVIGGTLGSPGGRTYAAFSTTAEEGAYQLTLGWSTISDTEEIAFDTPESRTFVARFYDQAGHEVSAETSVRLYCEDARHVACGGHCTDLRDDVDNCGSCGRRCDELLDGASCQGTECVGQTPCALSEDLTSTTTCDDVCGDLGGICEWSGTGIAIYGDDTCSDLEDYLGSCAYEIKTYTDYEGAGSYRCRCRLD
jgi:hypothetical protein